MKKIKISELPLFNSLRGLFTIGTDSENRSVKVSLEFVEDKTNEAVIKAHEATYAALSAKAETEEATSNAQDATEKANTATSNAEEAARMAAEATEDAVRATGKADSAAAYATKTADDAAEYAKKTADDASAYATKTAEDAAAAAKETADDASMQSTKAAEEAKKATENAEKATEGAILATVEAEDVTIAAQMATEKTLATLAKLIPSGLTVSYMERITLGNVAVNHIDARLEPEGTMPNILYISDNKAVKTDPQGRIFVLGLGASEVQVIPACNTALAKTIIIRVEAPTLRMVNTRNMLRLTSGGALRTN